MHLARSVESVMAILFAEQNQYISQIAFLRSKCKWWKFNNPLYLKRTLWARSGSGTTVLVRNDSEPQNGPVWANEWQLIGEYLKAPCWLSWHMQVFFFGGEGVLRGLGPSSVHGGSLWGRGNTSWASVWKDRPELLAKALGGVGCRVQR